MWVVELRVRYHGGPWNYGVDILEFRGDKVAREIDLRDGRLRGAGVALPVVGRAALSGHRRAVTTGLTSAPVWRGASRPHGTAR